MSTLRITVKYFIKDPAAVHLPDFIPVFHSWIQARSVEGLLVDVTDYKHVYQGPGVILIGHEVDYAIDTTGGRPGLLIRRKHLLNGSPPVDTGIGLQDQLRASILLALQACRVLEAEPSLGGKISFRTDEVELGFPDRLRAPNTPETFETVRNDILAVTNELYPAAQVSIQPASMDVRRTFTASIQIPGAPALAELVTQLDRLHPRPGVRN
jgi:hypothetical protein